MTTLDRRTFLAGASSAAAASISSARAQDLPKIRFCGAAAVSRPDLGFMFLGIPAGFYKTLGVDADFVTVAGSASAIQLVAANQAQIGHVGMMEVMAAKQRAPQLPIRAVYLQEWGSGYEVVVPAEGAIQSFADLKGKRVGVLSLATGAIPFVKAALRHNGVDPASVELLPVGVGAQALAALRSKQVDALSLFRGSHAQLENLGVALKYLTVPLPSSVLIVNEGLLKRNPQAVTRALQGAVLGTVYIHTNPEAAVRRYWDVAGKPPANEAQQLKEGALLCRRAAELWKQMSDPRPWGDISTATWRSLLDYMGAEGGVTMTDQQLAGVFSGELLPEVNRVDVSVAIKAAQTG